MAYWVMTPGKEISRSFFVISAMNKDKGWLTMAQHSGLMLHKYSKRFCKECMVVTRFNFKPIEGHSRCEVCNGYDAFDPRCKAKIKGYKRRMRKVLEAMQQ